MPQRVQRKRIKGWRAPEGCVYVGRPTEFGNPFTVMNGHSQGWLVWDDRDRLGFTTHETSNGFIASFPTRVEAHHDAVARYRKWIYNERDGQRIVDMLRGHDLMCYCRPEWPCHADVLLDMANRYAAAI